MTMHAIRRKSAPRLQMHSCDSCRRKKVRCDSVEQKMCSACNKAGIDCRFANNWKRRRRQPASSLKNRLPMKSGHVVNLADHGPETRCKEHVELRASETSLQESLEGGKAKACYQGRNAAAIIPESEPTRTIGFTENDFYRSFSRDVSSSCCETMDGLEELPVCHVDISGSSMSNMIKPSGVSNQPILVYPYPQLQSSLLRGLHGMQVDSDNVSYNLGDFPKKDICDGLVESFFEKFNPYFPIIDEADFRAQYANFDDNPPVLILHAVLLVGAHVSSDPKVTVARHIMKAVLFRRAKTIFDMQHEHNKLHLIQAALLLSWHSLNESTVSSNYFWLTVACRVAFDLGIHRATPKHLEAPSPAISHYQRLWRRIWWTLFQFEVMSALDHGRQSMVSPEDFNQEILTKDDFQEVGGAFNTKVHFEFCAKNIELSHIALDLIALVTFRASHDSKPRIKMLNTRLAKWRSNLPYYHDDKIGIFGVLSLQLRYQTMIIHLGCLMLENFSLPETYYEEAWKMNSSASNNIVAILQVLYEKEMIQQCHSVTVAAIIAAATHVFRNVQRAVQNLSTTLAVNEVNLLQRICLTMEHLSPYWANAEAVRNVLQSVCNKFMNILNDCRDIRDWSILYVDMLGQMNSQGVLAYLRSAGNVYGSGPSGRDFS